MTNPDRAWLAELTADSPAELAERLVRPSAAEERLLRAYFGPERFERLQALARSPRLAAGTDTGNVVVIPGLMGSGLTVRRLDGWTGAAWLSYWGIHRGRLAYLRLADNGRDPAEPGYGVEPAGILKQYYAELSLTLFRNGWNVREFAYDWRLELDQAADLLRDRATGWFGPSAPFHIVAHSMGGLVARTFIRRHPSRWKVAPPGPTGGRLIMLGTPNHGSFLIPQALTGLANTVWMLERLDFRHDRAGILRIIDSFPGLYQMLPSIVLRPDFAPLYDPGAYAGLPVSPTHCDRARNTHASLADVIDPARMIYLAGYGQPTVTGVRDYTRLTELDSYAITTHGDGSVPLALGPLRHRDGTLAAVPTYFFKTEHSRLPCHHEVLRALEPLLRTGVHEVRPGAAIASLQRSLPTLVDASLGKKDTPGARRQWLAVREARRLRFLELLSRLQPSASPAKPASAATRKPRPQPDSDPPQFTTEEQELLDLLATEFVGSAPTIPATQPASETRSHTRPKSRAETKTTLKPGPKSPKVPPGPGTKPKAKSASGARPKSPAAPSRQRTGGPAKTSRKRMN